MKTLDEVMTPHGYEIPQHLVADAEVPVLTTMQRQGDLLIIPIEAGQVAGLAPIPPEGVAVIKGENSANTHLLVGAGQVALRRTGTDIGTLTVEEGQQAYVIHTAEHGANGIGAGTYLLRRQREKADVIRVVAD